MTWVIGLTGGIASGKTTVANLFAEQGIALIDADLIARELVKPGQNALLKIVQHFGKVVLHDDGSLNRCALREIIFQNPHQRAWLDNLLHPLIRAQLNEKALQAKSPYCLLIIPLLTDRQHYPVINRVLLVDAPEHIQIQRLCERDKISLAQARAILTAQSTREARLALADDIIINEGDIAQLKSQVAELHQRYCQYAK